MYSLCEKYYKSLMIQCYIADCVTWVPWLNCGKCVSHSVMHNSLQSHSPQPTRLLCPWDFSRLEYWSGLPLPSPKEYCTITNKLAFAIHCHMDEPNTHKIDRNKTVKNENI